MIKRTTLRIAEVAAALRAANGNRTAVAKTFNITRTRLVAYIEKREALKAVEAEIRESWVDEAESELIKTESKVDFRKLQCILKTHGTSRGYGMPPPTRPFESFNVTSAIPRPDYSQSDDGERGSDDGSET